MGCQHDRTMNSTAKNVLKRNSCPVIGSIALKIYTPVKVEHNIQSDLSTIPLNIEWIAASLPGHGVSDSHEESATPALKRVQDDAEAPALLVLTVCVLVRMGPWDTETRWHTQREVE